MKNNNQQNSMQGKKKSTRGFASFSPERRREIARRGGQSAHEQGKAHRWTKEEARIAGKKGGEIRGRKRKTEQA